MSDLEIFDGESYRGVSRKKLLALVRKLREQRDEAIKSACASPEANQGSETWDEMAARDITADNAALDEIVRGG